LAAAASAAARAAFAAARFSFLVIGCLPTGGRPPPAAPRLGLFAAGRALPGGWSFPGDTLLAGGRAVDPPGSLLRTRSLTGHRSLQARWVGHRRSP
jgi:hypothetical protein